MPGRSRTPAPSQASPSVDGGQQSGAQTGESGAGFDFLGMASGFLGWGNSDAQAAMKKGGGSGRGQAAAPAAENAPAETVLSGSIFDATTDPMSWTAITTPGANKGIAVGMKVTVDLNLRDGTGISVGAVVAEVYGTRCKLYSQQVGSAASKVVSGTSKIALTGPRPPGAHPSPAEQQKKKVAESPQPAAEGPTAAGPAPGAAAPEKKAKKGKAFSDPDHEKFLAIQARLAALAPRDRKRDVLEGIVADYAAFSESRTMPAIRNTAQMWTVSENIQAEREFGYELDALVGRDSLDHDSSRADSRRASAASKRVQRAMKHLESLGKQASSAVPDESL
jgi:hypothetical protein